MEIVSGVNYSAFINRNEQDARQIQAAWIASGRAGIAPGALTAFGNAMHTAMDRTSPAQVGNQPWNGTAGVRNKLAAAEHVRRESYATAVERAGAAGQMRVAFLMVFGPGFYQQAVPPLPKPKIKIKIRYLNDDGSPIQD